MKLSGWIRDAIHLYRFLRIALRAYRQARKCQGVYYAAIEKNGVPEQALFVAMGREAWRVSVRAAEEFQLKETPIL